MFHHRVHRVATAAFCRIFSDEGKIGPGWWGWGVHAHPISLHLPSPVKLQCTLQLSGQIHWPCFISTNMCTLCVSPPAATYQCKRHRKQQTKTFLDQSSFIAVHFSKSELSKPNNFWTILLRQLRQVYWVFMYTEGHCLDRQLSKVNNLFVF